MGRNLIERLLNPIPAFKDWSRILKVGGQLVLSSAGYPGRPVEFLLGKGCFAATARRA